MKRRSTPTQPGVVDVAKVLAQTGTAPPGSATDISARPVVAVGDASASTSNDRSFADAHRGARDPGARVRSAAARPTAITYSFASPDPAHPRNPPAANGPARAETRVSGAASGAPARAPMGASLVVRSRPAEEVFSLRNVASGWGPHASVLRGESLNELRTIRDQIYRLAVNGCLVVGVASTPDAADAKARIAGQLAMLLAEPGRARVLFVEADFDKPAVHRMMRVDVPFSLGFSEQMRQRIKATTPTPWTLVRCLPNLHVAAEGLMRSPGLLSSAQFVEALSELRPYYDVIVAHGPVAGHGVDTQALDGMSDGMVMVGLKESTPSEVLDEAARLFTTKQMLAVVTIDG